MGSIDAKCAMLGPRANGMACKSPQRTGSLYQSDGHCSSDAFLLSMASLAPAQCNAPIARSTLHRPDGEFVELVNETTKLHLSHYAGQLGTHEEFRCAILMHGGQYVASPIMRDKAAPHHIIIDGDVQVVHDPTHPSTEVCSGIPMDNCK